MQMWVLGCLRYLYKVLCAHSDFFYLQNLFCLANPGVIKEGR